MDLATRAQYFTMDVITDLAMGAPFGDLRSDTDKYDFIKISQEALVILALVNVLPAVKKLIQIPFIGKRLFPKSADEFGVGRMIALVNTCFNILCSIKICKEANFIHQHRRGESRRAL
jgi:hypothetical protein